MGSCGPGSGGCEKEERLLLDTLRIEAWDDGIEAWDGAIETEERLLLGMLGIGLWNDEAEIGECLLLRGLAIGLWIESSGTGAVAVAAAATHRASDDADDATLRLRGDCEMEERLLLDELLVGAFCVSAAAGGIHEAMDDTALRIESEDAEDDLLRGELANGLWKEGPGTVLVREVC
jgi:hypothetical protein